MNKERRFKVDLSKLEQLKIDEVVKKLVVNDIKNKTKEEKYYFATRNNDIIMNHITIDNFDIIDYGVIFKITNIYDELNGKFKYYLYDIVAIRITKLERNSIYEDYRAIDLFNNTPAYYRARYGEDY
jgi:hypothetical protein